MFLFPFHLWFGLAACSNGWRKQVGWVVASAIAFVALSALYCTVVLGDAEAAFLPLLVAEGVLVHVLGFMMSAPRAAFMSSSDPASRHVDRRATPSP